MTESLPVFRMQLPSDAQSLHQFKLNLKIRALTAPFDPAYGLRSRLRVRIEGPQEIEPVELDAEVVFVSPVQMGMQIQRLEDPDLDRLNRMIEFLESHPNVSVR
ncbi:MAG TPA: hypothetical protein VI895_07930, partial [Bdellovibrionota bacterium]|nr:hypothetical protein [Bdellovibrionota bacterium]